MSVTPDRYPGVREEERVRFTDPPQEIGEIGYDSASGELQAWDAVGGPFNIRSGGSGITAEQHRILRQLIHFIGDGPAEGFVSGAYKETLPLGSVFPTSEIWWEANSKLKKIVELLTTWTGINITEEKWKVYDTDGTTVLWTVTDAITHTGIFEIDRTRVVVAGDA